MKNNYSYNNEKDFLSWYKNSYDRDFDGSAYTRPEGMSDAVWGAVSTLYSDYLSAKQSEAKIKESTDYYSGIKNDVLNRYSSAEGALNREKSNAQQNASISYDRLLKYLPKESTGSAQGISESGRIDALNKYSNTMAGISANYAENKRQLDSERASNISELDSLARAERVNIDEERNMNADAAHSRALEKYAEAENAAHLASFNSALNDIEISEDSDAEALKAKINEKYGSKVSENQLTELLSRAEMKANTVKVAAENERAASVYESFATIFESGDLSRAAKWLDANKDTFGESYDAYRNQIREQASSYVDGAYAQLEASDSNNMLVNLSAALDTLENYKDAIGAEEYERQRAKMLGTSVINYSNLAIKDKVGGNIDIVVGQTNYDRSKNYDLERRKVKEDKNGAESVRALNKITTGSSAKSPSVNTITVLRGKMYIYLKEGWHRLIDDYSDVSDTLNAVISDAERIKNTSNTATGGAGELARDKATVTEYR